MEKRYVYSNERGLRILKEGVSFEEYKAKVPGAILVKRVPKIATIKRWFASGYARAVDGCAPIEPDGTCVHGYPAWPRALNLI